MTRRCQVVDFNRLALTRRTPVKAIQLHALGAMVVVALAGCANQRSDNPESEEAMPPAEVVPKVLTIGIDGIRPDVLAEVPTPHLDRLAARGLYSDRAQTGSPTVSGPGWSSFLIGVWPEKHRVVSNDFSTSDYGNYPDFLTRLEQLNPTVNTMAVVDWEPLGAEVDGGPLISDAVDSVVVLNGYDLGWLEADSISGDIASDALNNSNVDAMFVYIGAADELSHRSEAIGAEYRGAIAAADRIVGRLVAAIEGRPNYGLEDWLIIMSSDHGRTDDGDHGGESEFERTIPFLISGPSISGGAPFEPPPRVVDVAVVALVHMGVEIDSAWALDGVPTGIVR